MSGIITTIEQNNSRLETLNNVFRSKLDGLGVPTVGNEGFGGLLDLMGNIQSPDNTRIAFVAGSLRTGLTSTRIAMSGTTNNFSSELSRTFVSDSSIFPVLNGNVYFLFGGVNIPINVWASSYSTAHSATGTGTNYTKQYTTYTFPEPGRYVPPSSSSSQQITWCLGKNVTDYSGNITIASGVGQYTVYTIFFRNGDLMNEELNLFNTDTVYRSFSHYNNRVPTAVPIIGAGSTTYVWSASTYQLCSFLGSVFLPS